MEGDNRRTWGMNIVKERLHQKVLANLHCPKFEKKKSNKMHKSNILKELNKLLKFRYESSMNVEIVIRQISVCKTY